MTSASRKPERIPLMRAFWWCMSLQALPLLVLVAGVWNYTADILDREEALAGSVLPNLKLAHDFTSASAGLQAQGLLLRSAETFDDLQLRQQLLQESITRTRLLIQSQQSVGAVETDGLAESIDQIEEVVAGLSDVRAQQIVASAQLQALAARQITQLNELLEMVQDRVVTLTDNLLDTRETLSEFAETRTLELLGQSESEYFATLDRFESGSLIIQDYLLFNQDLIGLKSILERLPLLRTTNDITIAEQSRDLLMQAMVSRAIYIRDRGGNDLLLTPLTQVRQALRGEGNVFARRQKVLDMNEAQTELSAGLTRLTIDVPNVTEQIRAESEAVLLRIAESTRVGLMRYRTFLFIVMMLSLVVLGSIGYWLLYRRTVLPLREIAARLDDVGTERFSQPERDYFIREIQVLSSVVGELDQAQRQTQSKDVELKRSNHELRKVNEDLEQFVHVASHDLQEPLRKLQQFSGLLEEDYARELDDDARFYLKAIANSARRMSTMIRDTLDYARSTRRDLSTQEVDLNALMQSVFDDADVAIAEAGAQVSVGDLPVVTANRAGISQLFGNLLVNAVKYRKPDIDSQITIRARYPQDDSKVVIDVCDNGVGIEEQFHERVFLPFERLGSLSVSGTGLGLSICSKVCDAHGWHLSVTSEKGVGSCFHVGIPLAHIANRGRQ